MTKVLCAGTFDIIHPGHLYYLSEAKKHGDELVVILARDETSLRFKGKKPVNDEIKRLDAVRALKIVDKAVLGRSGNIFDIIEEIKPDVICLGYDQRIKMRQLKDELFKRKLNAEVIRIGSYMPRLYKSSRLKK